MYACGYCYLSYPMYIKWDNLTYIKSAHVHFGYNKELLLITDVNHIHNRFSTHVPENILQISRILTHIFIYTF